MSKRHLSSSIDDSPKGQSVFETAQTQAVKEVAARQLASAIKGGPEKLLANRNR